MDSFNETKEFNQQKDTVILKPGQIAPNFNLAFTSNQKISLYDFRGEPIVLIFYPADWSPICGDQLALCNEVMSEFQKHNARLLGISVDSIWSHLAFSKKNNLRFPLLADFEPKGSVAKSYGVYDECSGLSRRALFIINPQGKIHWSYLSPIEVNPGADGLLEALELIPKQLTRTSAAAVNSNIESIYAALT